MYIGKMADAIQNEHHTIVLDSAALTDALFSAVDARDLPGMADVDSSLLLFCREIKRHVTVALSGECADEIFGGYPWYRDQTIREQAGFPWAQSNAWRKSFLRDEFADSFPADDYLMERYHATICDTDVLPDASPEERRMKEMMRLNTDWFMQTLLDRKDRMSMYNGLEVRVPFCDHRIAEYLYRVPGITKIIKIAKRVFCAMQCKGCCRMKFSGAGKARIPRPSIPPIERFCPTSCARF